MDMLLLLAVIMIVCISAGSLSSRWGVPTLLVFMVLGMLFGSDGIFKIPFDNYVLVEQICSVALAFIMFYGGFGTNWRQAKPVAVKAIALSTVGVVVTALITAVFCRIVLHFSVLESFLIGATISSTDAASVFSILRAKKLNLKNNTASLLEMESGSNDPASYLLTLTALSMMSGTAGSQLLVTMLLQVVVGLLIGFVAAGISIWMLRKKRLTIDGYNTLFVFALVICAYVVATQLGGNGYLSVYLFGILLGNSNIINKVPLVHFFDGLTGQAQIIIFFLLGLLSYPSQLSEIMVPSVAIALCLTLIARPVAVFGILGPMGCSVRQMLVVSFAGLRGAASIVFAIMAIVSGASIRWDLFHIVFCVCLLSVTFQGTLLPLVSKKLDMVDDSGNVMKTFNDYQIDQQLHLIKSRIPQEHPWVGKTIGELRLAADALVVMIVRKKQNLVPRGDTIIMADDILVFGGEPYWDEHAPALEELRLDFQHPWVGQQIKALPLSETELVVLIQHANGTTAIPKGNTVLRNGDTLVIRKIKI